MIYPCKHSGSVKQMAIAKVYPDFHNWTERKRNQRYVEHGPFLKEEFLFHFCFWLFYFAVYSRATLSPIALRGSGMPTLQTPLLFILLDFWDPTLCLDQAVWTGRPMQYPQHIPAAAPLAKGSIPQTENQNWTLLSLPVKPRGNLHHCFRQYHFLASR